MDVVRIQAIATIVVLTCIVASSWAHDRMPATVSSKPLESVGAAPIGKPGVEKNVKRTIDVDMTDAMRFQPATIDVKRGETVRFRLHNTGVLKHEMVLGTPRQLRAHAALMRKAPAMEHAHDRQASVVDPGRTRELVWEFTASGTLDFACLQAGHFEAGMRGRVTVKG